MVDLKRNLHGIFEKMKRDVNLKRKDKAFEINDRVLVKL